MADKNKKKPWTPPPTVPLKPDFGPSIPVFDTPHKRPEVVRTKVNKN